MNQKMWGLGFLNYSTCFERAVFAFLMTKMVVDKRVHEGQ